MLKSFFSIQFLTFLFVGGFAASVNWIARHVLESVMPVATALLVAFFIGMATAFGLNKKLVFPKSNIPIATQARRFVLINLSFLPVVWGSTLALVFLMESRGVQEHVSDIAHGIALSLPMLATFLLYKFFAFNRRRPL